MNEVIIHDYLKKKGLNEYGIAGLMGNLFAESGLNPQNLQNTYEKSRCCLLILSQYGKVKL